MNEFSTKQLGKVLPFLSDVFDEITQRNMGRGEQSTDIPSPLSIEQLGERLNVRINPNHKFDIQTLLSLTNAVSVLPDSETDYTLVVASYLLIIQQHGPDEVRETLKF